LISTRSVSVRQGKDRDDGAFPAPRAIRRWR